MNWLLTTGRWPCLGLLALVTAFLGYHAAHLRVDSSNAAMNADSAAWTETYLAFKRMFGNDEDLVLALKSAGALDARSIALLERARETIESLDGVGRVHSLATANRLVGGPAGAEEVPVLTRPFADPRVGEELRAAAEREPHLVGLLVSGDLRTAALVVELEERPNDDRYRGDIIDGIRAFARDRSPSGASFHLTGVAVQKHDVARFVERDQAVLVPSAVAVLAIVLAFWFRRPSAVALPLAVVATSLVWTLGCYAMAGLALNAVTSLLAPVVMVLSVATSVHLYHGWLEAGPSSESRFEAVTTAVRALRVPCAFTALTTALGFVALTVSDTPAVRQFGTFAALGVMIALVVGMVLVPLGLTFLDPPERAADALPNGMLTSVLRASARLAVARPLAITAIAGGLTVAAVAAIPNIRIDTDLVRYLRPSTPLRQDTAVIDRELAGVSSLELVLSRKDGAPLTSLADLRRMEDFENLVRRYPHVAGVYSVVAAVMQIDRAERDGDDLRLPASQAELSYAFDLIEAGERRGMVDRLVTSDFAFARISLRLRSIGSEATARLVDEVRDAGERVFGEEYSLEPTGSAYHVALDSNRIVRAQIGSFALALVLVMLAIGLLFRSPALLVLAVPTNLFPIVWTGGLMAVTGIALSTGTAMIASVVIGLAVDDTIHYMARYRRELARAEPGALERTSLGIGRALVITTVVLVLGFWVGTLGSFLPTVYFSLLAGIAMIGALLCDLLVLPVGLAWLARRRGAPI